MSFLQFVRILWARRWIIAAATLGCFLAALIATIILPPRYQGKSRVMMDIIKPDPVTGQMMSTSFARAYTKTQTELIRDYRVTGPVVDTLGWTSSPQLLANYNATNPGPNGDFRRWLAQLISTNTAAAAIEGSNILEITYTGNDAETARRVSDAVRGAYVDQSLAFKRESATRSADFFDNQLVKVRTQLAAAEGRKTAFERANHVVLQDDASDTESMRLKALASASAAPAAAAMQAAAGASPAALQLAQIDAKIASEAQTLGPNHPELQQLRQQRAALASAAASEGRGGRVVSAGGPSIAGQVSAQEAKVIGQRDKVDEARRLLSDVSVLRDQYTKTAARAAELHQQAESNESGLTLLGSALTPEDPTFPNMPLILFGSLGLGLALGVLASLVTELLSRRVRGVEDLAQTGVPVIIVLDGRSSRTPAPSLMQRLRLRGPRAA